MKTRVALLAFAIPLTLAASAAAQYRGQTVELNPFAGYLVGGQFGDSDFRHDGDHGDRSDLQVDDHAIYGGRVGYNFTNLWQMELEFAQSDTELLRDFHDHNDLPDATLADLRFQYFMGYLTVNFGHARWVPYFTIGSGAASIRAEASDDSHSTHTRYTAGVGGGVKWFIDPHFGLRFDGRFYSTYLGDTTVVCGPSELCFTHNWVSNFVANGGLIIAF